MTVTILYVCEDILYFQTFSRSRLFELLILLQFPAQPPVGSVGLSEQEAIKQGMTCDIYIASFKPMKGTVSGRDEKCMMKCIVEVATNKVCTATIHK